LSQTKSYSREDLGPRLISAVIRDLELPLDMGGTPNQFYPLRWIEMFKLWLPEYCDEITERVQGAYFMPIYQSFPIYLGLNMRKLPPRGSFLDQVCRQFAPESNGEERHDADDIRMRTRNFLKRKSEWAIDELVTVCGRDILKRVGLVEANRDVRTRWSACKAVLRQFPFPLLRVAAKAAARLRR